jgi:hypothetical protein
MQMCPTVGSKALQGTGEVARDQSKVERGFIEFGEVAWDVSADGED